MVDSSKAEIIHVESQDIPLIASGLGHLPEIAQAWKKQAESGSLTMIAAEKNDMVVGMVNILWDGADEQSVRDEIGVVPMINALGVNETYRGQGTAKRLMDYCEKLVVDRILPPAVIALGVEVENDIARNMYESRGYTYHQVGGSDTYTSTWPELDSDGNHTIFKATCVLMTKELS